MRALFLLKKGARDVDTVGGAPLDILGRRCARTLQARGGPGLRVRRGGRGERRRQVFGARVDALVVRERDLGRESTVRMQCTVGRALTMVDGVRLPPGDPRSSGALEPELMMRTSPRRYNRVP